MTPNAHVHDSITSVIGFILSPFVVAILAAWLVSRFPHRAGILAAWPALLAVLLGNEMRRAVSGGGRLVELPWAPSLGLSLSFNLDGLGLLFAILITGIGALIVLYASQYLEGHAHASRFYASLFAFMGAMLGVVLSDNILTLFVFWELTGFTSFLLIGFEHERAAARAAALQALIVTGAGGLALLAAGVLLIDVSGTVSLSAMATQRVSIVASPFYGSIAGLILLAAFTKSAQVPFHFWLPNAMEAPTPVSAYLHSATMVKAGVYLIARMTPVLGSTPMWATAVTVAGAATMVVGAYRSVQETDLKRILAYSTLSALGVLTMLLGVGTREAIVAALAYLVAHACYKGALFLVAGAIDHEVGTRDISVLAGLRRTMPITALAGGAAALSMAGVPLTLGFVGKDGAYEALLQAADWFPWLLALMVLASIFLGLAGLIAGVLPFRGDVALVKEVHDPPWPLWIPPLILAMCGLFVGVAPSLLNGSLSTAATAVAGTSVDGLARRVARSHAGTAAQRAHARGCRIRVRGARVRSDADVETAAWKRGSVRRHALRARRGEPRDRSGVAQRVVADVRHGHRGHVGPCRRRGAGHGSGFWLGIAAHQHHRTRCTHRFPHHRRRDCGDPRTIDDVGCSVARSGGLRRRHDVRQLRRARPRDDAVLGGDPHRAHLRAGLSTLPRTRSRCRHGLFVLATD